MNQYIVYFKIEFSSLFQLRPTTLSPNQSSITVWGKYFIRSYLLLIRTNCAVGWSWCCCRYRQRGNWFLSGVDCRKYSKKTGGGTRKNLKKEKYNCQLQKYGIVCCYILHIRHFIAISYHGEHGNSLISFNWNSVSCVCLWVCVSLSSHHITSLALFVLPINACA